MEFLRVASGEAAVSLAVLQKDDEALPPRARALVRLARGLTARPWALRAEAIADVARQGLDRDQLEAAVGVIAMFNYFTRVADATGIEFDYLSPLPAFEPDTQQAAAPALARQALPKRSWQGPVDCRGIDSCERRGNRGGRMCWNQTSR